MLGGLGIDRKRNGEKNLQTSRGEKGWGERHGSSTERGSGMRVVVDGRQSSTFSVPLKREVPKGS